VAPAVAREAGMTGPRAGTRAGPRRVLVAGAGAAGQLVVAELRRQPALGLVPVGFLDDDPAKRGRLLAGLPVRGSLADLERVVRDQAVHEVIVAMPSAAGEAIRAVLRSAQRAGVASRTVPTLSEILSGQVSVSALRPIRIEDLLRREPVVAGLEEVRVLVEGRTVLVTGAGGSIGGELCRQVAALGPARLVLLGHGENSLFEIAAELADRAPGVDLVSRVADVRDQGRMGRLLAADAPHLVFHNAAHKHVPLMELNAAEAVTNNVLGTRVTAEAAVAAGCEHFVLVSTDKAVRPTSVMGATKRVAEQVVRGLAAATGRRLLAVRFGNVLGSRGSVIPIFLRQIAAGGPVTVTHEAMRRYFMTIPEAVQLILQATVLGRPGDVLALDMGEPVRIVDLAADLVRLSGLEPGADIEIRTTGLRPGEKLYEEPFAVPGEAEATRHPKVLRARGDDLPADHATRVEALVEAAVAGAPDPALRALLAGLVPDYARDAAERDA
jgi:FlaA1/EpsC-like NDP-sugar epimerase